MLPCLIAERLFIGLSRRPSRYQTFLWRAEAGFPPPSVQEIPARSFFFLRGQHVPDPRLYQIAMLASLLVYGMGWLAFDITLPRAILLLAAALGTQTIGDRVERRPVNWRSALISGLSLCLLLRTNRTELAIAAAVVAVGAKFVFRIRGKHLFNPTNGGIVAMLLLTDQVWVSPGQWGSAAFFAFLMACLGGVVVNRASRSDVTYAFIVFYCALLFGRSAYLGEPMAIPIHRLGSGALLLFTFFMISDPKTTPDSRGGRILFAALVAAGGWYVQFRLFRTNGLLWSLAAFSLAVPLIDLLLPGARYTWTFNKEQRNETVGIHRRAGGDRRGVGADALRLLRLLRLKGGREAVQQGLAGRAGS
jgi:Na+-transporting NADH:ubiquinone oxidoreductase subunit NqrB